MSWFLDDDKKPRPEIIDEKRVYDEEYAISLIPGLAREAREGGMYETINRWLFQDMSGGILFEHLFSDEVSKEDREEILTQIYNKWWKYFGGDVYWEDRRRREVREKKNKKEKIVEKEKPIDYPETQKIRLGNPTNRQIRNGYWKEPIVVYVGEEVVGKINNFCNDYEVEGKIGVVEVKYYSGHHGGSYEFTIGGPVGFEARHGYKPEPYKPDPKKEIKENYSDDSPMGSLADFFK